MSRALVFGGALLVASPLHAQSWQTFSVERGPAPGKNLAVVVRHDLGEITIRPARDSVRYRASLRYDGRAVEPIYEFDADSGTMRIGSQKNSRKNKSGGRRSAALELTLGTADSLSLDIRAGAAETDLDLSGLPLTELSVSSGASDSRVRFERPNPVRMRRLTLSTGAASIVAERLGNANVDEIDVRSAVGEIELDLSGSWQRDAEIRAAVTLGALTIRVPMDVGVRLEATRVLASFSHSGLVPRDGAYVSENWATATRKLRIHANTVIGFLKVERR